MGARLYLGTRKSKLALTQSMWVRAEIEKRFSDIEIELVTITTKGDKILNVPLSKVGGKGLFVKEIEQAIIEKRVDFAVHSLKDVPTELPPQLEVSIFPKREEPVDAFISKDGKAFSDLPSGAVIGTSSLRRMAQLRAMRPDITIKSIRGNLDTRLKKLEQDDLDAIVLAAAGLNRMNLTQRITHKFSADEIIPAIGQGALGIEFRKDDEKTRQILMTIHHKETEITVRAERAFLARLEGGCQVPIGAYAQIKGDKLILKGIIGSEDGRKIIRMEKEGGRNCPEELGIDLAEDMLNAGGRSILNEAYKQGIE